MDKREFLTRLRMSLRWRMSGRELQGVLEDYGEYFATGQEEGRTQQQLCQQFGDPEQIAAALMAERGRTLVIPTRLLAVLLIAALPTLMLCNILFNKASWVYMMPQGVFWGTCLAVTLFSMAAVRREAGVLPSRRAAVAAWVLEGLLVVFTVGITVLCYHVNAFLLWANEQQIPLERLGPFLAALIGSVTLLLLVVWTGEVLWAWKLPVGILAAFPLNGAILCMLWSMMSMLGNMSSPAALHVFIRISVMLSLFQLVPLAALPWLLKRKEAAWTVK